MWRTVSQKKFVSISVFFMFSKNLTNGLIRQYFPKDRDFTTITEQEIKMAMDKLNNRPRKCLDMKTPNQVFFEINPNVALAG